MDRFIMRTVCAIDRSVVAEGASVRSIVARDSLGIGYVVAELDLGFDVAKHVQIVFTNDRCKRFARRSSVTSCRAIERCFISSAMQAVCAIDRSVAAEGASM
ncbi:hypothetical protein F2Q70_00021141 [Brassica cretica]|uniref:Uncharacterized protein n=1 Tax=Brassica cretica TaxID=69181 RepID=A0A8S9GNW1_BRACR|nr:hypothetical protein F2Q70_00021141 [Brassica cretica]